MHVHFIGVSGTGMGSLATLFREAGHEVSGSDTAFDPPIGPALEAAGITCLRGYDPAHLEKAPDLVVVGNVIRRDNVEAIAAKDAGLTRLSMSAALRTHFLEKRRPLVVCGTHGKTTTSAMCAWILSQAKLSPGWFIGGVPKNLPASASAGWAKRRLVRTAREGDPSPFGAAPFVVEGDEYDAVYWHKQPKFLDYIGLSARDVAIVTSVEHDHIDIYPDRESYESAFRAFIAKVPTEGLIVCDARDPRARLLVKEANARVTFYALERDDTGDVTPTWLGAPVAFDASGAQRYDVYAGGVSAGRFSMQVPGAHNVRNALAALAACTEGFGVPITVARSALAQFSGVRRRQDLLGEPGGVRVYDDFAHHPTAVDETLRALRGRHAEGKLFAVFEPRSATAVRSLHQAEYTRAFGAADRVLFAPLGRANVPENERLDLARLASDLGEKATAMPSVDAILDELVTHAKAGDTVALLSNGAFGGIYTRLVEALGARKSV